MTKSNGTIKSVTITGASGDSKTVEVDYPGPPPETVEYRNFGTDPVPDVYLDLMAGNIGKTISVTTDGAGAVVGVKVSP